MGKNVGKNISKNLSGNYSQKLLDNSKQTTTDALKTVSKDDCFGLLSNMFFFFRSSIVLCLFSEDMHLSLGFFFFFSCSFLILLTIWWWSFWDFCNSSSNFIINQIISCFWCFLIKFQPGLKDRENLLLWFFNVILQAFLMFKWKSDMYSPII